MVTGPFAACHARQATATLPHRAHTQQGSGRKRQRRLHRAMEFLEHGGVSDTELFSEVRRELLFLQFAHRTLETAQSRLEIVIKAATPRWGQ